MASGGPVRALELLKNLPRVALDNLRPLPGTRLKLTWCCVQKKVRRGQHRGGRCGRGNKGQGGRANLPRIGFEGGNTPFYLSVPKEPYYQGHHVRRQYPPLTLLSLQRLIDLGRIDPTQPIDMTSICNTRVLLVDPSQKHYGINLTDEGADIFACKVNIEVQWSSELSIAAVERNGGTILTKYYDLQCVRAMCNPLRYIHRGLPIPRCKLPPPDAVEYYSSAKNRGYLADPEEIEHERQVLAQKYGYKLPDLKSDPAYEMLMKRKDPRQIWFGLEPGWVINTKDKCILKPKDEELKEYYKN